MVNELKVVFQLLLYVLIYLQLVKNGVSYCSFWLIRNTKQQLIRNNYFRNLFFTLTKTGSRSHLEKYELKIAPTRLTLGHHQPPRWHTFAAPAALSATTSSLHARSTTRSRLSCSSSRGGLVPILCTFVSRLSTRPKQPTPICPAASWRTTAASIHTAPSLIVRMRWWGAVAMSLAPDNTTKSD